IRALCPSTAPRAPRTTLFPYTTLFRSKLGQAIWQSFGQGWITSKDEYLTRLRNSPDFEGRDNLINFLEQELPEDGDVIQYRMDRSEEHTSELQSRENLVCRLLLEKKKR